jgi:hypothetical protein
MNQQRELKLLKQVEVAAANIESEQPKLRTFVWCFRFAGLLGVFISVLLMKIGYVTILVGGIISAAGGLAMGLSIYFHLSLELTPILIRHINIESLKNRINEIERNITSA